MRFNCGPTWLEKHEAKKSWHRWFAWHAVRVSGNTCCWLEVVERKGERVAYAGWSWEYRPCAT